MPTQRLLDLEHISPRHATAYRESRGYQTAGARPLGSRWARVIAIVCSARLLSEPPLPAGQAAAGEQIPEPDPVVLDGSGGDASRDTSPRGPAGEQIPERDPVVLDGSGGDASRDTSPYGLDATTIVARPAPKRETQRITAAPNPMICIA